MKCANSTQLGHVRSALNKATKEAERLRMILSHTIKAADPATTAEYDDLCQLAAALEDLVIRFSHLWPKRER